MTPGPRTPTWMWLAAIALVVAGAGVAWWLTGGDARATGLVAGLVAIASVVPLVLALLVGKLRHRGRASGLGRQLAKDMGEKFREGVKKIGDTGVGLYDRPWFLLVGEPGAGKTEAIRHANVCPAGLNDPRQGAGGTVNMDWWFARGAVMLDTAGRLMFEDTPEWRQFLRLLKKYRPRRPINGVALAIPATSLQSDPADAIARKAGQIAQQLAVVQKELGVRFPVYVLVTKADLIPGWREYFAGVTDPRQQNQIVGWSNPDDLDEPFRPELVASHLATLQWALRRRRLDLLLDPPTLDEKRDRRIDRVDGMYGLPDNLGKIAPRLQLYLETAFMPNEWTGQPPFIRGIYFTQAMADGGVMDTDLAEAFGLEPQLVPESVHRFARDRTFFLKDVFLDKMFPESGLVIGGENVQRSVRRRRLGIAAAGVAGALAIGAGTAYSYVQLRESIGGPVAFWNDVQARRDDGRPLDLTPENLAADGDLLALHRRNLRLLGDDRLETPAVFRPVANLLGGDVAAAAGDEHAAFARRHAAAPVVEAAAARLAGVENPAQRAKLAVDLWHLANGDEAAPSLKSLWPAEEAPDVLDEVEATLAADGEPWAAALTAEADGPAASIRAALASAVEVETQAVDRGVETADARALAVRRAAAEVLRAEQDEFAALRRVAEARNADELAEAWAAVAALPSRGLVELAENPAAAEVASSRREAQAAIERLATLAALAGEDSSLAELVARQRDRLSAAAARLTDATNEWPFAAAKDQVAGAQDARANRVAAYQSFAQTLGQDDGDAPENLREAVDQLSNVDASSGAAAALELAFRSNASRDLEQLGASALRRWQEIHLGERRTAGWNDVLGRLNWDDWAAVGTTTLPPTPLQAGEPRPLAKIDDLRDRAALLRQVRTAIENDQAQTLGDRSADEATRVVAEAESNLADLIEAAVAERSAPPAVPAGVTAQAVLDAFADPAAALEQLRAHESQRADDLEALAQLADGKARDQAIASAAQARQAAGVLVNRADTLAATLARWSDLPADRLEAHATLLRQPADYDLADGWQGASLGGYFAAAQRALADRAQVEAEAAFAERLAALRQRATAFPLNLDASRVDARLTAAELRAFADEVAAVTARPTSPAGALPGLAALGSAAEQADFDALAAAAGRARLLAGMTVAVAIDRTTDFRSNGLYRFGRVVADGRATATTDFQHAGLGAARPAPDADPGYWLRGLSLADAGVEVEGSTDARFDGNVASDAIDDEPFALLERLLREGATEPGRAWRLPIDVALPDGGGAATLYAFVVVEGGSPLPAQ